MSELKVSLNEDEMLALARAEAAQRNANLRKAAADRLAKNAEWNRKNKPKKVKND